MPNTAYAIRSGHLARRLERLDVICDQSQFPSGKTLFVAARIGTIVNPVKAEAINDAVLAT